MVLYEEDHAHTLGRAASISMSPESADERGINYVVTGPLIAGPLGYRTLHEAMEAVETAVRESGATVGTSHKNFRYRPL